MVAFYQVIGPQLTSQPNLLPFEVGYEAEFSKVSSMKPPRGNSIIPLEAFLFFLLKTLKRKENKNEKVHDDFGDFFKYVDVSCSC